MSFEENLNRSGWTKEQDKAFEDCLALYAGDPIDRWETIAAALTGKTRQEIRHHYELLVEDLNAIESGSVPLPNYAESAAENVENEDAAENTKDEDDSEVKEIAPPQPGKAKSNSTRSRKTLRAEVERRKGIPWTPDEHRNFLKGLEKYGRGDWRSISRHCVRSRTPTQVASHAQKYFHRLNSGTKQRKRNSIHDVMCEDEGEMSAPQGQVGASAPSGSSTITEKFTPPIPLTVAGDTSNPFGSFTGLINEPSAAAPFHLARMMPPPSTGYPVVSPSSQLNSQLNLPSPTQMVYGFNAPLLNECSLFDISDVPFFY